MEFKKDLTDKEWDKVLELQPFKTYSEQIEYLDGRIEKLEKQLSRMNDLNNLSQKMDVIIGELRLKSKFK